MVSDYKIFMGEKIEKKIDYISNYSNSSADLFWNDIFFSSQDNIQTDDLSRTFTEKIAGIIFRDLSALSSDIQDTIIYELNLFIRKVAHFSVYLVMSIFIYAEAALWLKKYFLSGIVSVGVSMIYAVTDEFHQSLVPGRAPLVKDVFIDSCGAVVGSVICFLLISAIYFIKNHCEKSL